MIKSKLNIKLNYTPQAKGIWRFSDYLSQLPDKNKYSLNEGGTKEIKIEEGLLLKREDENPTGSLKDRGMAYLISWADSQNLKNLVISSSGNAAISAAEYCRLAKIDLTVFVSPQINRGKMKRLKEKNIKIISSDRPVSESIKFSQKNGYFNLRPSMCEFGREGYQTIAFELSENQGLIEDVFVPVSSGVNLLGIVSGFKKLGILPRIHVCQSTAVCPIASLFNQNYLPETKSLANALVAKFTPLRNEVLKAVEESKGTGWIIGNKEIKEALSWLSKKGIETSAEGALSLASFFKARESSFIPGKSVCLLTGSKY